MSLADQSLVRAEEVDGDDPLPDARHDPRVRRGAADRERRAGRDRAAATRSPTSPWRRTPHAALSGDDQRRWLGRLERDHDNIRAVLDRATAAGDGDTAIRLGFAMWRYWQKRGHLAEARRRLQAIADAAVVARRPGPPGPADGGARRRRLVAGRPRGDGAGLRRGASSSGRRSATRREIANALYNDSFRYAVTGDPRAARSRTDRATSRWSRSRDLATEIGDEHGRANALWGIGNYLYFHDADDGGIHDFEEALATSSGRIGDRTMEAWSHHMLSTALIQAHDLDAGAARTSVRGASGSSTSTATSPGSRCALDDFAAIAVADGRPPAGRPAVGRRAGAVVGGRRRPGRLRRPAVRVLQPAERAARDRRPSELEQYAAEGRAMTLDESVAYALETSIDALAPHDHVGTAR